MKCLICSGHLMILDDECTGESMPGCMRRSLEVGWRLRTALHPSEAGGQWSVLSHTDTCLPSMWDTLGQMRCTQVAMEDFLSPL